jgi:aspartyl/asparaginyl beta-hydroxylase (cupin superfamily)
MRLIWLNMINGFFDLYTGGTRRPVSFEVRETCAELDDLTQQFPAIRRELDALLPYRTSIPEYHRIDKNQTYIAGTVDQDRAWRTYMVYALGERNERYAAQCPRTAELLGKVPNITNAFFSILDPGKSIPPHEGGYRGLLRYHLGLLVPADQPPHIRVKDRIFRWKEGDAFIFDDSWEHEVINHSPGLRVILAVDILRPMPWLPHTLNRLALWWMGRSDQYQQVNDAIKAAAQQMPS